MRLSTWTPSPARASEWTVTGEEFLGSSRIALEVKDPPFTRLRYFEMPSKAAQLEASLKTAYPGRDIRVYPGDCNDSIPQALRDLEQLRWAPTFAFLDPDGMELSWETITALAEHKRGYRKSIKLEYKVELWILFPSGQLLRTLALDEAQLAPRDEVRARRLFGTDEWRAIYEQRVAERIPGPVARERYLNLYRWRLEEVLGYRRSHALEVRNMRGVPMYHMVFATDNSAGDSIMSDLYGKASSRFAGMRMEAIQHAHGQGFFDFDDADHRVQFEYQPPVDPSSLVS
jgi:three-Cys-motif partner protein